MKKIFLIIISFFIFYISSSVYVNANEIIYTDVMTDLKKDSSFDVNDYEVNPDDYSLKIIQIAESNNRELFIYVFHPSFKTKDLKATTLKMDFSNEDDFTFNPKLYNLELLSSSGLFEKYKVLDFNCNYAIERYYSLIEISREKSIELDTLLDLSVSEISYPINQKWQVLPQEDKLLYNLSEIKTLELEIIESGNVYISADGFSLNNLLYAKDTDSWFVCFYSKNFAISQILNATLEFEYRTIEYIDDPFNVVDKNEISDWFSKTVDLSSNDTAKLVGKGWFSRTFEWNRICLSDDYLYQMEKQGMVFDSETRAKLDNVGQYLFAFWETEHFTSKVNMVEAYGYFEIRNLSILRIEFIDQNCKTYNLGVVVNKININNDPVGIVDINPVDNLFDFIPNILDYIIKIVSVILGVLLLYFIIKLFILLLTSKKRFKKKRKKNKT